MQDLVVRYPMRRIVAEYPFECIPVRLSGCKQHIRMDTTLRSHRKIGRRQRMYPHHRRIPVHTPTAIRIIIQQLKIPRNSRSKQRSRQHVLTRFPISSVGLPYLPRCRISSHQSHRWIVQTHLQRITGLYIR